MAVVIVLHIVLVNYAQLKTMEVKTQAQLPTTFFYSTEFPFKMFILKLSPYLFQFTSKNLNCCLYQKQLYWRNPFVLKTTRSRCVKTCNVYEVLADFLMSAIFLPHEVLNIDITIIYIVIMNCYHLSIQFLHATVYHSLTF